MQSGKFFVFFLLLISVLCVFVLTGCGGRSTTTVASAADPTGTPSPPPDPSPAPSPSPTPTPDPSPSPTPTPTPASSGAPSNATVVSKIEDMPGWQWCTATQDHHTCAAGLGNAVSTMTDHQSQPSRDGSSAKFTISGPTGYSNALWWETLEPNPNFSHFNYDLWFYVNHPEVSQALEFDVNQTINGTRYTWGSECNFKADGKWDVWDPAGGKWAPSKVDCRPFSANAWHHLLWQLERVNGQVHYISLTVDNHVFPVDIYMNPQTNWIGNEIDVAFQMDGDNNQQPYDVWLNQVTLTQW